MPDAALPSRRTMLRAIADRDAEWDGIFVFAVTTTGVACRPTCPARRANRDNVRFFPTLRDATHAGFRPCRRCRPEQPAQTSAMWDRAVRLADDRAPAGLDDQQLRAHGLDPVRLRRLARRRYGMTFHAWLRSRRIANAQRRLHDGEDLDTVILSSGYASHSGFRDAFTRVVGKSPGRARTDEPIAMRTIDSPIGPLIVAAVDEGVCLLEFSEEARVNRQAARLVRWFAGPIVKDRHPHLDRLTQELDAYFAGALEAFTVPVAVRGTDFERRTWSALTGIPYGETRSYLDVARAIGSPGAVRAVGSANGRNRISIVIPCHRVVNADGNLGGYGGGLWRKRRLLELEGATRQR